MIIIIIIIIIITIAFKGAIWDFWHSPHYTANRIQHVYSFARTKLCANPLQHIKRLGPKYTGTPGVNAQGSWNQTAWSLQWAICYTMKQHLETVLYKPLCHRGFKVSCAVYPVYQVKLAGSATAVPLHLTQFAVPFVHIVTTVCSQGTWFYTIFLWHVQCMVHGSRALGWFNPLFFEPFRTSPQPAIWLRKVGLLSSQSEPWVEATCSLEIEHPRCAENQALANHWCSAKHVLLHALVKYTIQPALQSTFSYTRYNSVVWTLACATSHVVGRDSSAIKMEFKSHLF